jgi:hypothetical protein
MRYCQNGLKKETLAGSKWKKIKKIKKTFFTTLASLTGKPTSSVAFVLTVAF